MSLITTQAVVLRSQGLGDADKLVTLFTINRGKVRAVAKGARRSHARFGASLEPFMYCNMVLFERRSGNLLRINQTEILHPFMGLRQDLGMIFAAARMVCLVSALMPDAEANPKILSLLLKGLSNIEKGKSDTELVTRFFEIHLLKYAGYLPKIDRCLKCDKRIDADPVFFSPTAGGTVCGLCYPSGHGSADRVSRGTLAFFAQNVRMGWDKLDRIKPTQAIRDELRNLLNASICHVTGQAFRASLPLEI